MSKNLFTTSLLLILFSCFRMEAQDPVFSHVDANRLYYNPAFTGFDKGIRIAGGYRRQWPGIVSEYTAYNFSAEAQAFNIGGGVGLMLSQNTQGEGYLSRTRMGFCYSYQIITKEYQLSLGTKVSSVRTSIDWSRLQFSDQLDPVYGNIYQTQALPPEIPYRNFVDFDWGAALRFNLKVGDFKAINTIGLSWLHSTQPDESIMNTVSRLPSKISVQASTLISQKRAGNNAPRMGFSFLTERQADFTSSTFGLAFIKLPVYLGGSYRARDFTQADAVIIYAGLINNFDNERNFRLMYSYDVTVSNLAVNSGGTHEISIVINLEDVSLFKLRSSNSRGKERNCYRFRDGFMPAVF